MLAEVLQHVRCTLHRLGFVPAGEVVQLHVLPGARSCVPCRLGLLIKVASNIMHCFARPAWLQATACWC
jgi:hypothetical protein